MIANLVFFIFFMFTAMRTKVNSQFPCTSYTGSVCRDVIGSGPVVVNLDSEAMFRTYKRMYTNSYLKVNVDAQCDAFLRAQYCGVSTVTCTDRVYCGAYDDDEIGQCGVNSCKCSGANIDQQTCNKVLRDLFTANGGGRNYYKTGQQPQGKNCTTFNIPCPSAAMGLKFPLIGLLATAVITFLGVMVP